MDSKKQWRERIWALLEEKGIATFPRPVYGRIPNFRGAERAAYRLNGLEEWRKAKVVKINPDAPQKPARRKALEEGKKLLMPTPRLRDGFLLLDPDKIPRSEYGRASTIKGAFSYGVKLGLDGLREIGRVDFILEGSVVVNRWGERIGKGEGYGELEFAILRELGLVDDNTPISTTVHDLQVTVERLPQDPWDVPIDYILTPTRTIRAERGPRPKGVLWGLLPEEKVVEIPILGELRISKTRSATV